MWLKFDLIAVDNKDIARRACDLLKEFVSSQLDGEYFPIGYTAVSGFDPENQESTMYEVYLLADDTRTSYDFFVTKILDQCYRKASAALAAAEK